MSNISLLPIFFIGTGAIFLSWILEKSPIVLLYDQNNLYVMIISGIGFGLILFLWKLYERSIENEGKMELGNSTRRILLTSICADLDDVKIIIDPKGATGGRDSSNSIVLKESHVSRNHFEIACRNNHFYLRDCGSTTGTFWYLRPKEPFPLSEGMILKCGESQLEILSATILRNRTQLRVAFIEGPSSGILQTIGTAPVTIGRNSSNSFSVPTDITMSNKHCKIFYDPEAKGYFAKDLCSTNGSGIRLSSVWTPSEQLELQHEDIFGVGDTRFRVEYLDNISNK